MRITFSPMRGDMPLSLALRGDTLVVNGKSFDFSDLPDGAELSAEALDSPWFVTEVRRDKGKLLLGLILPHGAGAPPARLFPAPLEVDEDGPIPLPPHGEDAG